MVTDDSVNSATAYARRGLHVFLLDGKRPRQGSRGFHEATTSEDRIRAQLAEHPDANVAIATGASGLVVIDVDGEAGEATLAKLEREHGDLPATVETITGGGGRHLIYRAPEGRSVRNVQGPRGERALGSGVDVRGDGGYIVAPPSIHPETGQPYRWREGRGLDEIELAELPAWLVERLDPPKVDTPAPPMVRPTVAPAEADRVARAISYISTMAPAIQGAGGHSSLYAVSTVVAWGFDLPRDVAIDVLAREFNPRCMPPWDLSKSGERREFERKVDQALRGAHDQPRGYLAYADNYQQSPGSVEHGASVAAAIMATHRAATNGTPQEAEAGPTRIGADAPIALSKIITANPHLHEPVINGIIRRAEIANIIAAAKAGKSWLAYYIGLCIITGGRLFDAFDCSAGRVLLIDNELHPPTIAHRIPKVAEKMGIRKRDYANRFDVLSLRGRGVSFHELRAYVDRIAAGYYKAIIADAWYRFIPAGTSENDNAGVMALYNLLDAYAESTDAAWIVIHHASKGQQGEKAVTDVGAGAGAQSRAADTHIVLRPHQDDECVVLDAALRSFPPVTPIVLRWDFPIWRRDLLLNPDSLKGKKSRGEERQDEKDKEGLALIRKALADGPLTTRKVRSATGLGAPRAERLLDMLTASSEVTVTEVTGRGGPANEYAIA